MAAAALVAALLSGPPAAAAGLAPLLSGVRWGEPSRELVAQFGARATVLTRPLDFGDSYVQVVLRDVRVGGVPLIAFFQMDKATGGLKRVQLERQRHGVTLRSLRLALAALEAEYGAPDAVCGTGAAPASGYQAAAERVWRRDGRVIRLAFRDTTVGALESCVFAEPEAAPPCGLTGQLLVRISPAGAGDLGVCRRLPR